MVASVATRRGRFDREDPVRRWRSRTQGRLRADRSRATTTQHVALEHGAPSVELHLATGADVADEPGIVVHRGLRPNSAGADRAVPRRRCVLFADPRRLPADGAVRSGAARLPLVATDVGALREIVQDGRTGLIVEPGNVRSLVAALSRLITDANLRRTCGDNAAALVADRFDAAKNSARIVDLLLDIMGPSAARTTG